MVKNTEATAVAPTKKVAKKVAKKVVKEVNYADSVLLTNKLYKQAFNSLGAIRSALLTHKEAIKLDKRFERLLIASQKSKLVYEFLNANVRVSKKKDGSRGKYGIFYTLQSMAKVYNSKELANELKALITPTNNAK
jgi:hypothetical protein